MEYFFKRKIDEYQIDELEKRLPFFVKKKSNIQLIIRMIWHIA